MEEKKELDVLLDLVNNKYREYVLKNEDKRVAFGIIGEVPNKESSVYTGGYIYGNGYNLSLCIRDIMRREKAIARDIMFAAAMEAAENGYETLDEYGCSLIKKEESNERRGNIQ